MSHWNSSLPRALMLLNELLILAPECDLLGSQWMDELQEYYEVQLVIDDSFPEFLYSNFISLNCSGVVKTVMLSNKWVIHK